MSSQHAESLRGDLFPIVRFAAVRKVWYATTDDRSPEVSWLPGSAMLVELADDTFGIVITGSMYSRTVYSQVLQPGMLVWSDSGRSVVRWASPQPLGIESKSWTYLRFYDAVTYLEFNFHFYDALLRQKRASLVVEQRLSDVAYAIPSKFTAYCRRYLGGSYFDELSESECDEEEPSRSPEDSETEVGGDGRWANYELDSELAGLDPELAGLDSELAGLECHDTMDEEFNAPEYRCTEESEASWEEQA